MWLLFALASLFFFGLRGILYQWSSTRPIERNLMLLGVYATGSILAAFFSFALHQSWTHGAWVGILMGICSFVANASMFKGFAVGKASLVAILTALSPVIVVSLAYVLWGETLNVWQSSAFIILLVGIVLIRYSNELSFRNLRGVQWAALAMVMFGLTDTFTKQSKLWSAETFPTLTVSFATGFVLFAAMYARNGNWRHSSQRQPSDRNANMISAKLMDDTQAFRPEADGTAAEQSAGAFVAAASEQASALLSTHPPNSVSPKRWTSSKVFAWGMTVGLTNFTGMALIMPAMSLGVTGLVSAVVAMNVLMVILYARLFLKEQISRVEQLGIVCTVLGIVILKMFG